jgi:hypothetical protein
MRQPWGSAASAAVNTDAPHSDVPPAPRHRCSSNCDCARKAEVNAHAARRRRALAGAIDQALGIPRWIRSRGGWLR